MDQCLIVTREVVVVVVWFPESSSYCSVKGNSKGNVGYSDCVTNEECLVGQVSVQSVEYV